MIQQTINFFAQNPLFLGLGLLVGAALWLLIAALLSVLLPASDEAGFSDTDHSWESIPAPLPQNRYVPVYDGPQSLSLSSGAPILFKPSEPASPVFSQLKTFPAAATNLAPVVVEEKPDTTPQWVLKERLESLAEKLQSLEQAAPSTELAHFDDKVTRLTRSLGQIHESIHSVSHFEEQKTQLEEKIDELSRRFLARLNEMAAFESAAPVETTHPVEESVRREIESALENARREREGILRESEAAQAEIRHRIEESRQSEATLLQEIGEAIRAEEETITAKGRELDQMQNLLADEKKAFEIARASAPPLVSLEDLRKAQDTMHARLTVLNEQQERDRQRQERLLENLHRRLALWQSAWRTRLAGDQSRWDAEWRAVESQRNTVLAQMTEERAQVQARMAALQVEEGKIQAARADFQKSVVDVWAQERAVHDLEARHIADQSASMEAGIHEVQASLATGRQKFEDLIRKNRAAVRAKQAEWKEQLKLLQEDFQKKSEQAKDGIARETENFEKEKNSLIHKESVEKDALARQAVEWQAAQAQTLEQIAKEKEDWKQKLAQGRSRVQELENMRRDLEAAYSAERSDQSQRIGKQRAWTEQRLETLHKLLDQVRKDIVNELGVYAREKNVVMQNLQKAREDFRQRAEAAATDADRRRKALDLERREAEAEHAAFLARSWDDEQKLRQSMDALEKETAALEKKLDVFRAGRERVILRLQERHERILLRLHQEVDQMKVQGESKLAEEKSSLETMKARLANRQSRLTRLWQKRDEELQGLFNELNAALELVRQGHRSESQVWINRLKSLQSQRDMWLKRREAAQNTNLISQEMQEREKRELARFEQEESRLRTERENYWKIVAERSAANQEALHKLMEDIRSGDNPDRREAIAMEVISRIREQLALVRSFQKNLRPSDTELPSHS